MRPVRWVMTAWTVIVTTFSGDLRATPKFPMEQKNVVAVVGNRSITYKQFSDRYEDYLIFSGVQDNIQARFAVLNNMINEILLRQYDDNSSVYANPEYKKEIASAWNRTVLAFLEDREVYAKITVSESELREAYQRSKIKLAVRHLYAATSQEADRLYRLAAMGVSFHELAKQAFTDTALRNNGGYLGYIGWGDTDPDFENAAYSLKIGEISRPVKTSEGYSVIRVDDRIEDPFATENDFVNRKHKLERALRIAKKIPYENAFLDRVFDKSKVRFDEKSLQAVLDDVGTDVSTDVERGQRSKRMSDMCVVTKDRKYTQADVERMILGTPEFNRRLLKDVKTLKEAMLGLLMQNVLLDMAKAKGYDTTSYVDETYRKLTNNIYLNYKRNEILSTVPVSDSEVTRYYRSNISSFTREPEINVQEIVVDSDSAATAIREKIDRGGDFGTLAETHSLRKWSSRNRGIMGLSPLSSFGLLKDTLWTIPLGKVIGPIAFDRYYGVFRVLERRDGQPIDPLLVRDQIVRAVRNEKGFAYMKKHLEGLSKKTTITVDDDLVKAFALPSGGN